jgi:hypothetical protein
MQRSDCYASPLGGCHNKLTAEHVVSDKVLRDIVSSGSKSVAVDGHRWQREPRQRVGIANLKAKILCQSHNSALSPFDDTMRAFGCYRARCLMLDRAGCVMGVPRAARSRAARGGAVQKGRSVESSGAQARVRL